MGLRPPSRRRRRRRRASHPSPPLPPSCDGWCACICHEVGLIGCLTLDTTFGYREKRGERRERESVQCVWHVVNGWVAHVQAPEPKRSSPPRPPPPRPGGRRGPRGRGAGADAAPSLWCWQLGGGCVVCVSAVGKFSECLMGFGDTGLPSRMRAVDSHTAAKAPKPASSGRKRKCEAYYMYLLTGSRVAGQ